MRSPAELLASLPEPARLQEIAKRAPDVREQLLYHWPFWARPEQLPPAGAWATWLVLAGGGGGKTRPAAEWVRSVVCGDTPLQGGKYGRLALIGETAADCRDVIVEGEGGGLKVHPKAFRPAYEPSKRRLTWPNGAVATLYSGEDPDQLRGPQHDAAWADELAKWRYADQAWDMLQFGLRLGDDPRQIVTTTPRPIEIIKQLMADPSTVTTRGVTTENRFNLSEKFIKRITARYEGTRLGRQELSGGILDAAPGWGSPAAVSVLWAGHGAQYPRLIYCRRTLSLRRPTRAARWWRRSCVPSGRYCRSYWCTPAGARSRELSRLRRCTSRAV